MASFAVAVRGCGGSHPQCSVRGAIPEGHAVLLEGSYVTELTDAAIDQHVIHGPKVPGVGSLDVKCAHDPDNLFHHNQNIKP